MEKINFETYLSGIKEDIKISINDLFNAIEIIRKDVEMLKSKETTD